MGNKNGLEMKNEKKLNSMMTEINAIPINLVLSLILSPHSGIVSI